MSQTFSPPRQIDFEIPSPPTDEGNPHGVEGIPVSAPAGTPKQFLKKGTLFGLFVVVLVGAGFAVPGVRGFFFGETSQLPDLVLAEVKRDRFLVSVTERGTIGSVRESILSSNVEGLTRIIFIVPEGADVKAPLKSTTSGTVTSIVDSGRNKKVLVQPDAVVIFHPFVFLAVSGPPVAQTLEFGAHTRMLVDVGDSVKAGDLVAGDVVCELDSSELVEKEKQQLIGVTQAKANLEKAQKNVEIQRNQNISDQSKAGLDLELARLDLKKFVEGERSQQANELRVEVLNAQETLTQAQEAFQYAKRLAKKGYKNQVELDSANSAVFRARNSLSVAREKLTVLTDFTFERTNKELVEKVNEAGRELKRVHLQGLAAVAQFQAELSSQQLTYSVERQKLRKLQQQIAACRMVAPQEGKVVYAKQKNRGGEPIVIEEGTTVYQRQRIISLPDFTRMKVDVKIHEGKIKSVHAGLEARIRVDALPDRTFRGIVESVPDVPVRGAWPNYDLMLFETQIRIVDEDSAGLKPGMNAHVEIVADERDDVLQAPVQSILPVGDGYVAWAVPKNGTRAEIRENIKVGATNNESVEIEAGLTEGDRVVMNAKVQFRMEFAALKSDAEKERAANAENRKKQKRRGGQPGRSAGAK